MNDQISTESVNEVLNLVKARNPFIYIVSHDEEQCIREIYKTICLDKDFKEIKKLFIWSSYSGLIEYNETFFLNPIRASGDYDNSWNLSVALNCIQNISSTKTIDSIYILRDFYTALTPPVARQIKDMYTCLSQNTIQKTIIGIGGILGHNHGAIKHGIEPSLEKQMTIVRWNLPTREQIEGKILKELNEINSKEYSSDDVYKISRALQGLNFVEIDNATAISIVEKKKIDPNRLMKEKKQIIMRSDILEYIESNNTMKDLGGLDNLKTFLHDHANSASEEAKEFGVDPLRGIILVGIPGAGKSYTAKCIGNTWGIPTLRLDVGKVMAGLVGSSEQRMREAVQQAIASAPCIWWIDEIEKALSGTKSSNFSDGGTLSRVFGTLLTAMEEELPKAGVTVVATANDISMLPPELIRRFSETFYVGLPTEEERKEIWTIHLNKKKRDPSKFDLSKLSKASDKFTGAEIEKALKETISTCFNDNKREVKTNDIIQAIKATKPLYIVMFDKIKETEEWAKTRARFASSFSEAEIKGNKITTSKGKKISLANLDDDATITTEESKHQEVIITPTDEGKSN